MQKIERPSRKRRLLFVLVNLQGGGAEKVVLRVMSGLASEGFKVTLFLFKAEGEYLAGISEKMNVVALPGGGRLYKRLFPGFCLLVREVRKHDVVVGGLELFPTYIAKASALLCGEMSVGWVHTDIQQYLHTASKLRVFFARLFYSKARNIVCVSEGALKSLCAFARVKAPKESWSVIYNPIPSEPTSPSPVRCDLEYDDTSRRLVIAAGRLTWEKGFDLLIEAHAQLIASGCDHNLLILGEGSERHALESKIHDFGVAGSVLMPGFVQNPSVYFRQADMMVSSSRYEGFSMVIVEALAAGLPVVSTDCPSGPSEVLGGGEYGLLVEPNSVQSLAEGMRFLLKNDAVAARFSRKARRRAECFSPERIMPQWKSYFENLLG